MLGGWMLPLPCGSLAQLSTCWLALLLAAMSLSFSKELVKNIELS